MKRQKTLNRFLGLVEEDESNSEEEGPFLEPSKQSTVPQYWTSVKDRSQLNVKQVRSFDIEEDVAAFINESDFKKDHKNVVEQYLFDTDSFKLKDPTLVPTNHTPSVEELEQLGQLVSRLRNQFETRGLQLLQ